MPEPLPDRTVEKIQSEAEMTLSSVEQETRTYQNGEDGPIDLKSILAPPQSEGELGRLAQYRVLKVLGKGGMGMVLLAEDTQLRRLAALKIMLPKFARDASARERFLREARAAARIRHDNVITIHQVGEENGVPFIAMEYLKGQPLDEHLKSAGEMTLAQVLKIGREIAEGLQAAHSEGLIHRDIKPANVWLEAPRGRVKILDFGLAREQNDDIHLTKSGAVVGTPAYMAPEQARGQAVDARTDLWSLGVLLYRLCTGQQPFTGQSTMAVLTAIAIDQPEKIRTLNPNLPPALENLIELLLAKDAAKRPASAQAVADGLAAIERSPGSGLSSIGDVVYMVAPAASAGNEAFANLDESAFETEKPTRPTKPQSAVVKSDSGRPRKKLLIGGGLLGLAAIIAAGFIIIKITNKDGSVTELKVPDDSKIEVTKDGKTIVQMAVEPKKPDTATANPKQLTNINDPAFQKWMKDVQALPAEEQITEVSKKLQELNPGFDGKVTGFYGNDLPKIEGGAVVSYAFIADNVTDLSPVLALVKLRTLICKGSGSVKGKLSDLTPLRGMQLTYLDCAFTMVSNLSPLQGMKLTHLYCYGTQVVDLSQVEGMPLKVLDIASSRISDLSPLQGMALNSVAFTPRNIAKGLDVFRNMKSIKTIGTNADTKNLFTPDEFWKKYDAGEFGKPITNINDPAFQKWMKDVQALPAEKQIEEVAKKLKELNPGFDGKLMGMFGQNSPKIVNGVVTEFEFYTNDVTDISPVRALAGLKALGCLGSGMAKGKLLDLSPLQGMPLKTLRFDSNPVADLSPLQGMPLTSLFCNGTKVSSLLPLRGLPLTILHCGGTAVTDLSPLRGMPLTDLSCQGTKVSDLSPLQGMPLASLALFNTSVSDLSSLQGMSLSAISFTPKKIAKGLDAIRQMKSLKRISIDHDNRFPPEEFWKKYDGGEFGKPITDFNSPAFQQWMKDVQALPAEKQVEEVAKKLMELNPGFDGKMTGYDNNSQPLIEQGAVAKIRFVADNLTDISPVRALSGLKSLVCTGSNPRKGQLSDLTPLQGMNLTYLAFGNTMISDLSPLRGMKLQHFYCYNTPVSDLSPLEGMPLSVLNIAGTPISDLSPLRGMKLANLNCVATKISDLSPLQGMNLEQFCFTPSNIVKGLDAIRQMNGIKSIEVYPLAQSYPAAEFWKKYDAGEFGKPITDINDPAFQKWMKDVAALPAEKQLEEVAKKLQELNPGFNGKLTPTIANGSVTGLWVNTESIVDIAPVRAFANLTSLNCSGSRSAWTLSDLSPLRGMKLTNLTCIFTKVSDLSPLEGMPLTHLTCGVSWVADLSPLKGMPLKELLCGESPVHDLSPLQGMRLNKLDFYGTKVADLSPLKGMPLTALGCLSTSVTDLSPLQGMELVEIGISTKKISKGMEVLREMKSLKKIGIRGNNTLSAEEFWKKYDAGEIARPTFNDPAFQKWMKDVQALPAEEQLKEVAKKLMELNPGFDGKLKGYHSNQETPRIADGTVTELRLLTEHVTDISPVRAFAGLQMLSLSGSENKGVLTDIGPLQGMPLTTLHLQGNLKLSDLSPLQGMKLKGLMLLYIGATDLSPLKGMPLETLTCASFPIADLSPLAGMKLTDLNCADSKVTDLSPLRGMPLKSLHCYITHVTDLSPLQGMPLTKLNCDQTPVSDLSPLETCRSLKTLVAKKTKVSSASVAALQKALPDCKIEWDEPKK